MTKQTTPLRQRMIDDMIIRNMSPSTQKIYIQAVANFARFHRRSPDKLGLEDVRLFQLHLATRGLKATTINPFVGALRFFYRTTLKRDDIARQIPYSRQEDRLPCVLSHSQVFQILKAEQNLKYRTAYITIYAAGLRVSEVVKLTPADINSERMVIHIQQAKGRKDRYVMLPRQLLHILRDYWSQTRPPHWLFPGQDKSRPITTRSLQRPFRKVADSIGLDGTVTLHTLRHSFATHLLEQGVDIRVIQQLLGHRNIVSTSRYAQVALKTIQKIQSPLEELNLDEIMTS